MSVIRKPIVTEKVSAKGEHLGQYGFVVDKFATKPEIKSAIESLYGVTVVAVNTINYGPEYKTKYSKTCILTQKIGAVKKAIVTLKKGDVIDFYSNI